MPLVSLVLVALLCFIVSFCSGECENGCSGHGRCTLFDMCICNRNWMGNDCSERICEFGLSFVDVPKGDLDSSDTIESSEEIVIVNSAVYPYGTSEQYPVMEDSDYRKLTNSAHYYSECSDAGICNRKTGVCDCFDGFGGAACQRMLCPGEEVECSGHGICQSLRQIAREDHSSTYELWDRFMNRGCVCDKGFYGGDCSMRRCKHALDPMYLDDVNTIQYPSFFFAVLTTSTTSDFSDGFGGTGYYNIKVYDVDGQVWYTGPIQAGSSCDEVIKALEGIPHRIIPEGTAQCEQSTFTTEDPLDSFDSAYSISYQSLYHMYKTGDKTYTVDSRPAFQSFGFRSSYYVNKTSDTLLTGDLYLIQFYGNPGTFQQPEINVYLNDGILPTVTSPGGTLITKSWTNGQQGTSTDYFTDHCKGVKLSVISYNYQYFLYGSFIPTILNKCLFDVDFTTDNDKYTNYGWDHGTRYNPHIVKLVRTVTDVKDGGFLVVFYFDTTVLDFNVQSGIGGSIDVGIGGAYRLLHPFHSLDDKVNVLYDVYTTKGVLKMIGNSSEAVFDFASNSIFMTNTSYDTLGLSYDGELSCESLGVDFTTDTQYKECLDKGDKFLLLDPFNTMYNPPFLNLYTAKSIRSIDRRELSPVFDYFKNVTLDRRNLTAAYHRNVITTDLNTNWAQDAVHSSATFHIYKFMPSPNSTFEVIAECSNRGICNTFEGVCDCFNGYTGQACQTQDSLAT